jgi:hypothetical protein
MLKVDARRQRRVRLLVALGIAWAWLPGSASSEPGVELEGTWHVLIHYKNSTSGNPEQDRWLDLAWEFEEKAEGRLRWSEYPIVVFANESGRFERRSTGQHARTLGKWEPNDSQVGNIREGLEVNARGVKKKRLVLEEGAWVSRGSARRSASFVSYETRWRIEPGETGPVFQQSDFLGSADSDEAGGVTRYETLVVGAGGTLLIGRYQRDENRSGIFRMVRSGSPRALTGRSQAEIQGDAYRKAGAEPSWSLGGPQQVGDGPRGAPAPSLGRVLEEWHQMEARASAIVDRLPAAREAKLGEERREELIDDAILRFYEGASDDQVRAELTRLVQAP